MSRRLCLEAQGGPVGKVVGTGEAWGRALDVPEEVREAQEVCLQPRGPRVSPQGMAQR